MNFDFSDDQKALKSEARRFLAARSPLAAARGVLNNPAAGFDPRVWSNVGEQGWCGAAIPEEYGGLGLGHIELCALAEELGRSLAPVPFASSIYLFAEALLAIGTQAQKAQLLPAIASGKKIGCLAVTEGPGETASERLQTRYAKGKLTGVKIPVTDGAIADLAVVLASDDGRPGLFVVELSGPGVSVEAVSTLDPTRGAAKVTFSDAPVLGPIGAAGEGLSLLERILDRGAILLAFEQLGGAERALEMARDYALDRYAFGRPIGGLQAIKHKLADVFARIAVARANAYYGAWALAANAPELPLAAAGARIAASDAFWQASKENIQVHGGIGFTWEADCHLFFRRARHLSLVAGAPSAWKRRLVDRLEASFKADA